MRVSNPVSYRGSDLQTEQLINFIVGGEEFAIDLLHVREVINCPEITRLPRTPVFVEGVIDLRGDIIPVIDMCVKLDLRKEELTLRSAVIIVEIDGKHVGAIVDRICQVIRLNQDQISPPVKLIGGLSQEYVRGVGKLNDRLIVILDVNKVFSSREVRELAEFGESQTLTGKNG